MNALLQIDSVVLWQVGGWTMLHFLWLGTLAGMTAAALRFVLWRAGPNSRYLAALMCLLVLAALPFAIAAWLVQNSPVEPQNGMHTLLRNFQFDETAANEVNVEVTNQPAADGLPAAYLPVDGLNAVAGFEAEMGHLNPRQSRGLTSDSDIATLQQAVAWLNSHVTWLPWLWLAGTPITLALLATGIVGSERLRRSSRPVIGGPIAELGAQLAKSLRVGRRVTIAVCERVAAPVLVGILRPMILLPPSALTGWSPDEIEMVLLHEFAHVRRWDNFVNLIQRLIESLLFFHPAVWLVSRWVRSEREACCDAFVVGRTSRPHAYAELLVALAAHMPRSVLFQPAASSALTARPLRKRIRRILQLEDDPMLISRKSFAAMLAAFLTAIALCILYLPKSGHAEDSAAQAEEDASSGTKAATTEDPSDDVTIGEGSENSTDGREDLDWWGEPIDPQSTHDWFGRPIPRDDHKNGDQPADFVVFRNDRQVARRAWMELGLKLVPASEAELEQVRPIFRGGLKLVEFEGFPHLESPFILTGISSKPLSMGIASFSDLEKVLDAIAERPADEIIALSGVAKNGNFNYAMRRPKDADEMGSPTENESDKAASDVEEKVDWTLGKESPKQSVPREKYLTQVYIIPTEEVPLEKRNEFKRQINQLDPPRNVTFRWSGEHAAVFAPPWVHEHLKELFQRASERAFPFPSLEEQKLADLAYQRLQLELEPINEEELERVKALGYDGGVSVAQAAGSAEGPFQRGDILLGLHVWPTTSMEAVAEILNRDDLAQLNPLKFYVARTDEAGMKANPKYFVHTGRILVNLSKNAARVGAGDLLKSQVAAPAMKNTPFGPAGATLPATIEAPPIPSYVLPSAAEEAKRPKSSSLPAIDSGAPHARRDAEPHFRSLTSAPPANRSAPRYAEAPSKSLGPRSSSKRLTNPAEIKALREHVKLLEEQFERLDALYKTGSRGGSASDRALAGYELARSKAELALTEGQREKSDVYLQEAKGYAEEALKSLTALYEAGNVTYDVLLQSARNLSEIKRQIAQRQNQSSDSAPASAANDSSAPPLSAGHLHVTTTHSSTAPHESIGVLQKIVEREKQKYDRLAKLAAENAVSTTEVAVQKAEYEISLERLKQAERALEYYKVAVELAKAEYAAAAEARKLTPRAVSDLELRKLQLRVQSAEAQLKAMSE